MLTREQFHELFLDFSYDLLAEPDAAAVREYLAAHPDAQAEIDRAKTLLAGAARVAFPHVSFQAPLPETANAKPLASPRVASAMPKPKSMSRVWLQWAVAAAVLLVIGGLAGPGIRHYGQYSRHKELADQKAAERDEAQRAVAELTTKFKESFGNAAKSVKQAESEYTAAVAAHQTAKAKTELDIQNQKIVVTVTGPQAIQPGAPNEFEIATRNLQGDNMPTAVTARVRDKSGKVLFETEDPRSQGHQRVILPPDMPYKMDDVLTLEVTAVSHEGPAADVTEKLTWSAPRYVTNLATDKPMYKPGEHIYFRSLTLNRVNLQPPQEDFHVTFSILNPAGAPIWTSPVGETRLRVLEPGDALGKALLGPDRKPVRGIGCGEFLLPEGLDGGEYTLTVHEEAGRFPDEKRKFMVNKYSQDRLNKELEFNKKSYGPGDEVEALCKVSLADGGPLVGVMPRVTIMVDQTVFSVKQDNLTDAAGHVRVKATLPKLIDKGIASMTVEFNDGGNAESIVRTIPIVMKKLYVEYFPEGGDVVAGVPNRVYYQVKTARNKPGDLKGHVVDSQGNAVATTETLNDPIEPGANQGLGVFAFTPKAGEKYALKIDEPAGVDAIGTFPAISTGKIAMSIPTGVTGKSEPIHVELYAAEKARNMLVGAYCRGRLLDQKPVKVQPGQKATVDLNADDSVGGVVRVTAFEEESSEGSRQKFVPRAERLVYRRGTQQLHISIAPDKSRYAPAEKVNLTVSATDEQGRPARAILNLSVVNQSIITMADEKTARSLPTAFAFLGEVRQPEDLEHADFLLNESNPKAAQSLDLLLGVQGWRRFAEQNRDEFRKNYHQEAERLLVIEGLSTPYVRDTKLAKLQEIEAEFTPKLNDLADRWKIAHDEKLKLDKELPAYQKEREAALQVLLQKNLEHKEAMAQFAPYRNEHDQIRAAFLPATAGILIFAAFVCLLVGLVRGVKQGLSYHVAAVGAVGVAVLLMIVTVINRGSEQPTENAVAMAADTGSIIDPATAPTAAPDTEEAATELDGAGGHGGPAKPMNPAARGFGGGGAGAPGAAGGAMPKAKPMMMRNAMRPPAGAPAPAAAGGAALPPGPPAPIGDDKANKMDLAKDALQKDGKAEWKKEMDRGEGRLDERLREKKADAAAKGANALQGRAMAKQAGGANGVDGEMMKRRQENRDFEQQLAAANRKGGINGPPGMGGGRAMGGARGGFGQPGGGPGFAGDFRAMVPPPAMPFIVREYSHVVLPRAEGQERTDFTETVFWHPAIVLDEAGKANVSFQVSDSVTKYRVLAAGHTLDGRLGSQSHQIEARKAFSIESRLPVEMTANDKLDLPVIVVNDTDDERAASISVIATNLEQRGGKSEETLMLKPNQRTRRNFRLQPTVVEGMAIVTVKGKSEPFAPDGKQVRIPIVPEGFPVSGAISDMLEKVAEQKIRIPEGYLPGTLKLKAEIYPSTLAALQKGLEGLLREPGGCFEQTSTTNYPNTLILQYLKESGQGNPNVEQHAKELLGRGYGRLTSFECLKADGTNREGYEWFGGQAPPHEALTAYGLLQFNDMSQVSAVDQEMVKRTRHYLLSRMHPDGTFERNGAAIDTFGRAPEHITDAYIVWALSETGDEDVTKAIDRLNGLAKDSKDPYFLSLLAQAMINRGRRAEAVELLKKVKAKQVEDGGVEGAMASITMSGGHDLKIETTALAVLAWFKVNQPTEFANCTEKAVRWIGTQRGGYGGFGSTQSTILALKALIAHTKANKKTPEGGTLMLFVNNQKAGETTFAAGTADAVTIDLKDAERILKIGENTIRLELTTKGAYPFTLGWSYQSLSLNSAENCAVKLTTALNKTQIREGETVRLTATIENRSAEKGQPMTTAVIGLPAGLKIPEDMKQLKDLSALKKTGANGELTAGDIAYFEIRGRELVLYWRDLKPGAKIEINLDLIAAIPGEFRGPASRAYLYYTSDLKQWLQPLSVTIEAQLGE